MLRTQFEEDLLNLHNQFYEMGMMVSSAVHKSVRSYIDHDKNSRKRSLTMILRSMIWKFA